MHIKSKKQFNINDRIPLHTANVSLRCEYYPRSTIVYKIYCTIINKIDGRALSKNGKCSFTCIGEGDSFTESLYKLCYKIHNEEDFIGDNPYIKDLIIQRIIKEHIDILHSEQSNITGPYSFYYSINTNNYITGILFQKSSVIYNHVVMNIKSINDNDTYSVLYQFNDTTFADSIISIKFFNRDVMNDLRKYICSRNMLLSNENLIINTGNIVPNKSNIKDIGKWMNYYLNTQEQKIPFKSNDLINLKDLLNNNSKLNILIANNYGVRLGTAKIDAFNI